ncbi:MAG: hypothetical protein VX473_01370 [Candidatus Thermoplasmatota archaeon]|nr:hypothetical protein [Candidatus Thermoplasmatota archaeon]
MKIGFLFGGVVIIGVQVMADPLWDFFYGTEFSLLVVGMMFLVEGLASEPRFDHLEAKIIQMQKEIYDLKYPMSSSNED